MALQVTNTLTATITSTEDSTGNVAINRGNGNPAVDAVVGLYIEQFKTLGAGFDTKIPSISGLDTAEIDQLYIKNNDANAIITVKWSPVAHGGQILALDLQPGSQLLLWETTTGRGVASVTVASSVGGTFCEIFIGSITG
jgi:hypothetical protein